MSVAYGAETLSIIGPNLSLYTASLCTCGASLYRLFPSDPDVYFGTLLKVGGSLPSYRSTRAEYCVDLFAGADWIG